MEIYVTPEDGEWWDQMAKELGLRGRGTLIGIILGGLVRSGLEPRGYEEVYDHMESLMWVQGKPFVPCLPPQAERAQRIPRRVLDAVEKAKAEALQERMDGTSEPGRDYRSILSEKAERIYGKARSGD